MEERKDNPKVRSKMNKPVPVAQTKSSNQPAVFAVKERAVEAN